MASLLGFATRAWSSTTTLSAPPCAPSAASRSMTSALSVEVMRQVCTEGPGHYPGSQQTLELMQRDYFYPLGRRPDEPEGMGEQGRPTSSSAPRARSGRSLAATSRPISTRCGRLRSASAADSPAGDAMRPGAAAQGTGGMSRHCRAVVIGGGAVGCELPSTIWRCAAGPTACCWRGTSSPRARPGMPPATARPSRPAGP